MNIFESCPSLTKVTESNFNEAWVLIGFVDTLDNPYTYWGELDDLDKVQFIMNLEDICEINIDDVVGNFLLYNDLNQFKSHFRDMKLNQII